VTRNPADAIPATCKNPTDHAAAVLNEKRSPRGFRPNVGIVGQNPYQPTVAYPNAGPNDPASAYPAAPGTGPYPNVATDPAYPGYPANLYPAGTPGAPGGYFQNQTVSPVGFIPGAAVSINAYVPAQENLAVVEFDAPDEASARAIVAKLQGMEAMDITINGGPLDGALTPPSAVTPPPLFDENPDPIQNPGVTKAQFLRSRNPHHLVTDSIRAKQGSDPNAPNYFPGAPALALIPAVRQSSDPNAPNYDPIASATPLPGAPYPSPGGNVGPTPAGTVSVTPAAATLSAGKTQAFSANGFAPAGVTWTISPAVGSIGASGLYTAPATIASPATVTVTATSISAPVVSTTATVSLAPSPVSVQ
jgi:hypothetical protein